MNNDIKKFRLLLISITYLLIGILEAYSYFMFKENGIGLFVLLTILGFIVTFKSELNNN